MTPPKCPQHEIPMLYVGRVPAWENRRIQAEGWHCPKCTIEIQRPIPESPTPQTPCPQEFPTS